ncbi:hypothetical protein Ae505Ps2_1348 [Pseudonocardia sp. Ae505_Ps2]|nr:hypothetical protein Ae505Ps2_1348 [Pseudonocardia sp. Ae505_Ps2]
MVGSCGGRGGEVHDRSADRGARVISRHADVVQW